MKILIANHFSPRNCDMFFTYISILMELCDMEILSPIFKWEEMKVRKMK